MTIRCLHGFFLIREDAAGEISRFMQLFPSLSIVPFDDDFYTFEALADPPEYVVAGNTYLGAAAGVTFAGRPWEIMRANDLVFDWTADAVVPIATITDRVALAVSKFYLFSSGLVLPGSVRDDGLRVIDYAARYLFDAGKFKYSEVTYG